MWDFPPWIAEIINLPTDWLKKNKKCVADSAFPSAKGLVQLLKAFLCQLPIDGTSMIFPPSRYCSVGAPHNVFICISNMLVKEKNNINPMSMSMIYAWVIGQLLITQQTTWPLDFFHYVYYHVLMYLRNHSRLHSFCSQTFLGFVLVFFLLVFFCFIECDAISSQRYSLTNVLFKRCGCLCGQGMLESVVVDISVNKNI